MSTSFLLILKVFGYLLIILQKEGDTMKKTS